jgi:lipopolysaccharide export LptBFGC system permease protein LptF
MGKTLFWYIFKDLLKIFLLASGAIAGIMSFAGLLRPLSQHSLAMSQVSEMLGYFLPAMTNYSWPVAALFATTFVYGRLAADNELTACRSAGISFWAIMLPAGVLGLLVSALSLVFLFYIVPESFLRAERVVYSNLAQFVSNKIERTQRVIFDAAEQQVTVFARGSAVLKPNPERPSRQAVQLNNVAIVTYRKDTPPGEPIRPQDYYLARAATALIDMPDKPDGDVMLTAMLEDGAKVPRETADGSSDSVQAAIKAQVFGPFPLPSPVRETARFMNLHRLQDLRANPERGKRVSNNLKEIIRTDQRLRFLNQVEADLTDADRSITLRAADGEYTIIAGPRPPVNRGGRLVVKSGAPDAPGIRVVARSNFDAFEAQVFQVTFIPQIDTDNNKIILSLELQDAILFMGQERLQRQDLERQLQVDMPADIADIARTRPEEYLKAPWISPERMSRLKSALMRQQNEVESELHARVSFAVSCLVLVLVGATIGTLFRSGNFISAFAISTVPALMTIVLIVTGQHMCENVPHVMPANFQNPMDMGLKLVWGGNAVVAVVGSILFFRLSRT